MPEQHPWQKTKHSSKITDTVRIQPDIITKHRRKRSRGITRSTHPKRERDAKRRKNQGLHDFDRGYGRTAQKLTKDNSCENANMHQPEKNLTTSP